MTDDQQTYWNRVAEIKTFTHPIDISLLEKFIRKNALIVDYGCGYGRLVKILNEVGFTNIKGFDTSKELIRRGRQQDDLNIYHITQDADLPIENNSADCILLFAVLTCIPSNNGQAELIELLYSKLKPGGILYISDYYLQHHSTEMERYGFLNDDPENYGVFTLPEGATFRHHTKEWIGGLLRKFNIRNEVMVEVKTMNGSIAEAFQLVAEK